MTGGPAELDLLHAGIGTIIWATGASKPSYSTSSKSISAAPLAREVKSHVRRPSLEWHLRFRCSSWAALSVSSEPDYTLPAAFAGY